MVTKKTKQVVKTDVKAEAKKECPITGCACLSPKKTAFGLGVLAVMVLVALGVSSLMSNRTVIINFDKVKQEAVVYQSILTEQMQYEQKLQAKMALDFGALQKEDSELTAKKAKLKPAEFQKKVEALRAKVAAAQQKYDYELKKILAATQMAVAQVQKDIEATLEDVAESENAGVVLNTSAVVYVNDDTNDITDAFVAALNQKVKPVAYPNPDTLQIKAGE